MPSHWEWRKASGGWSLPSDEPGRRRFHAYDESDHAACDPIMSLSRSCEEPNEGSYLCPECIEVVKANPGGRPPNPKETTP